ncbi:site-specific integrase [Azohydromonas australica]|uniref:site-specific integrase n=1 Tax=Azohydromonas australica TaxID=364039 RepID=UPI0003F6A521|nr:site-specific integrase [Azohydromonas australica]
MEMRLSTAELARAQPLPDAAALSALRAWHEGMSSREAVTHFIPERWLPGGSSRSVISDIRRQLAAFAASRQRGDLARLFTGTARKGAAAARDVAQAVEALRHAPIPQPLIGDDVSRWLPPRVAAVLHRAGIKTLAVLTLRVPRRRRWWNGIAGLGQSMAAQVEGFFAAHPDLTERARALVTAPSVGDVRPWERIVVPSEGDGTQGTFRAPRESCSLRANNDYEAVQTWLSMHEAPATQRAYRKEAERLMLWAIFERGLALSSLTTEDAAAYRAFLRHPALRSRWVGPATARSSPLWRPFTGGLSPRSIAYALSVLGALFRRLIAKRYVLANPFAGIRVRGARVAGLDTTRGFSGGEWQLLRTVADALEWSYGWTPAAAQRMRFVLDFGFGTGLRASELVNAVLGNVEIDAGGEVWLRVVGKGSKPGKVVLPLIARSALETYLVQRQLPVSLAKWDPGTPLLGSLDDGTAIIARRLWAALKRFFATAATVLADVNPALAEKLGQASPHWLRHSHVSHALESGADLTTVRDNLRHASVSTTSLYLHADDERRARQIAAAFSGHGKR